MAKLKLGAIADDKPVKLTWSCRRRFIAISLPMARSLARETGQGAVEPAKLVGPMLARFMATDRAFAKLRRADSRPQRRRRDRASSRRNATNRPTVASSNPGSHANAISIDAFGSSITLKTTPGNATSDWLAVAKVMPKPAPTSAKTHCLLAACERNRAPLPRKDAYSSRAA